MIEDAGVACSLSAYPWELGARSYAADPSSASTPKLPALYLLRSLAELMESVQAPEHFFFCRSVTHTFFPGDFLQDKQVASSLSCLVSVSPLELLLHFCPPFH